MKKFAKILSMILALIFVVSAFAACQTPDDPAKESGNNQGSETDPVIETDLPKDPLQLTEGDTCKYTVVRPMNAGDAVKNASVNIKNALSEAIGGNAVSISEDFLASNMKPGEFEILVGNTNREESAKAIEGFKYFDYAIVIEGSKLVINEGAKIKASGNTGGACVMVMCYSSPVEIELNGSDWFETENGARAIWVLAAFGSLNVRINTDDIDVSDYATEQDFIDAAKAMYLSIVDYDPNTMAADVTIYVNGIVINK